MQPTQLITLLLLSFVLLPSITAAVVVSIDPNNVIGLVDGDFLQATLDISALTDSDALCNMSSPVFENLVRGLRLRYLRVGGTAGDFTYLEGFDAQPPTAEEQLSTRRRPPPPPYTRVLHRETWDSLMTFCKSVGISVIFGLNAGPFSRTGGVGAWNSSNAEAFVRYNVAEGNPIIAYEFGNEPNLYFANFKDLPPSFPSGKQWAADMATLRAMLNKHDASLLTVCCDVIYVPAFGEISTFVEDFIASGGLASTNITTWHAYPTFSQEVDRFLPPGIDPFLATPERLVDPLILDQISTWGLRLNAAFASKLPPNATIPPLGFAVWLGETADASFGGQQNVSDAFVDVLQLFDTAGQLGRLGHRRMFRQELCAKHSPTSAAPYALINVDNVPRPSYFAVLLFKHFFEASNAKLGQFAVGSFSSGNGTVRAYALRDDSVSRLFITLINLDGAAVVPDVCLPNSLPNNSSVPSRLQLLDITSSDLTSRVVLVNGNPLSVDPVTGIPQSIFPAEVAWYRNASSGCWRVSSSNGSAMPRQMKEHSVWMLIVAL